MGYWLLELFTTAINQQRSIQLTPRSNWKACAKNTTLSSILETTITIAKSVTLMYLPGQSTVDSVTDAPQASTTTAGT